MKRIVALLLVLTMALCSGVVFASAPDGCFVSVGYIKQSRQITVSGKFASTNQQPFTVTVVPDGTAPSDLNDSNLPVVSELYLTEAGGNASASITLPSTLPSGKYFVYVSSAVFTGNDYIIYTKDSEISALLPTINAQTSSTALRDVLDNNRSDLGIDSTIFDTPACSGIIAQYLFSAKPQGGYTTPSVFSTYLDQANAWALIKSGSDVRSVLRKYESAIGMSYNDEFMIYPAAVQTAMISYLENADYTSKPFTQLIKEIRVLSYVKSSTSWEILKKYVLGENDSGTVYVDNFSLFEAHNTNYNLLEDKNAVYIEMFKRVPSLNDFNAVKAAFASCVTKAYEDELSQMGPSSSPVGGVSGSVNTNPVAPVPGSQAIFSDIYGHWAANSIDVLYKKGVVSGFPDGTFRPEQPVTRAEFAKLLTEALGFKASGNASFIDVLQSDWFAPYVNTAAIYGIVLGNDKNEFVPNAYITREDACVMISRCIDKSVSSDAQLGFSDKDEISPYAEDAIKLLYNEKIVTGVTASTFVPKGLTTRAQAVALLTRALDYISAK